MIFLFPGELASYVDISQVSHAITFLFITTLILASVRSVYMYMCMYYTYVHKHNSMYTFTTPICAHSIIEVETILKVAGPGEHKVHVASTKAVYRMNICPGLARRLPLQ